MQLKLGLPEPDGYEWIYVASFTTRSGRKIYAKQYGKKAFRIPIKKDKKK